MLVVAVAVFELATTSKAVLFDVATAGERDTRGSKLSSRLVMWMTLVEGVGRGISMAEEKEVEVGMVEEVKVYMELRLDAAVELDVDPEEDVVVELVSLDI